MISLDEFIGRDENTVNIAVNPRSGFEERITEHHRLIHAPHVFLPALGRIGSKCENTKINLLELKRIPHTAIYENSGPAILGSHGRDIVSQKSTAHRSISVDYKNSSFAGFFKGTANLTVIFKAPDSADGAAKT